MYVCMLCCNCMYVYLLVCSCMEEQHLAECRSWKSKSNQIITVCLVAFHITTMQTLDTWILWSLHEGAKNFPEFVCSLAFFYKDCSPFFPDREWSTALITQYPSRPLVCRTGVSVELGFGWLTTSKLWLYNYNCFFGCANP